MAIIGSNPIGSTNNLMGCKIMGSLRIYIAGKYTCCENSTVIDNIKAARSALIDIMRMGHFAYAPHCHLAFLDDDAPDITYDQIMEHCLSYLKCCDGIYMLPEWESSNGAVIEKELAEELGIPVYYSYEELPIVLRHQSVVEIIGD